MADEDRIKWDAKYRGKPIHSDPSGIVSKYCQFSFPGRALDIACGTGRNSVYLSENGFAVDAVDISSVAAEHLKNRYPRINVICADLDAWKIPIDRYDLVVNIRFLDRNLFSQIQAGLKPGGLLIFESFTNGAADKYCLKSNELLHTFAEFRVIYYEEKKTDQGERYDQVASLVAIKPVA